MAIFRSVLLLFAAAALCKTSFGQNCSHLPRPSGSPLPTPSPGNDLTYCRTSESQCCSESYLTSEANSLKNNRLLDSLHDQLNETGGKLDRIGNRLLNYTNRVILPAFINRLHLPFNFTFNTTLNRDTIQRRFLIRDAGIDFRPAEFTDSLIDSQISLIIFDLIRPRAFTNNGSARLTTQESACVRTAFRRYINTTTKDIVDESFEEFRRAMTTLNKLAFWYNTSFLPNLRDYFTASDACVNAFIRLRCRECIERIPPLCRGVCNSVIYGCFAVTDGGLRGQFNVLWNTTSQLVNISRRALQNIADRIPRYLMRPLNASQLFNIAANTCRIRLNNHTNETRQQHINADNYKYDNSELNVPIRYVRDASDLLGSGLVSYGRNGPYYCSGYNNTNCWNGAARVNTYVSTFNGTSINDQVNNPFLEGVTISDLQRQASALGNPVTDYITSEEFLNTAPQNLTVPEDTPTGSGASFVSSSILLLFSALAFVLFVFN